MREKKVLASIDDQVVKIFKTELLRYVDNLNGSSEFNVICLSLYIKEENRKHHNPIVFVCFIRIRRENWLKISAKAL